MSQPFWLRMRIFANKSRFTVFLLIILMMYVSVTLWSTSKQQQNVIDKLRKDVSKFKGSKAKLAEIADKKEKEMMKLRDELVALELKRLKADSPGASDADKKDKEATALLMSSLKDEISRLKSESAKMKKELSQANSRFAADAVARAASASSDEVQGSPSTSSSRESESGYDPIWKPTAPGGADVEKQNAVRDAMKHSWSGYEKFAWGADELRPVSKSRNDWLGQGGTIVDALDTLWIMGLKDEFNKGADWVANSLQFNRGGDVSFFETTIRILGGLLSAYELSGNKALLDKARDIGDRLGRSFEATPSGLPMAQINLQSGHGSPPGWTGGQLIIAEVGTVQLEFITLSKHTGDPKYENWARKVYEVVKRNNVNPPGMFPLYMDPNSGSFSSNQVSLGALGDSFFEYLIKVWLLTGRKDDWLKGAYDDASNSILDLMYKTHAATGLKYVAEWHGGNTVNKMDHLACFTGGMFALGAPFSKDPAKHLSAGDGIAEVCYNMYKRSPSGLSAEYTTFDGNDLAAGAGYNILRPEAIEAIFYMWRATHDPKYRQWGWEMFQSFEKWCKVDTGGYAGLRDVRAVPPQKDDTMQTFWLAETLKYFYLLFSDDSVIPMEDYVFNTEAHPLRVWKKGD